MLAGAGGFAGSAIRYIVSVMMFSTALKSGFPVGTLLINAIGSLLIGIFWVALPQGGWQTLAMAGFCGGFTTFSAFSLESLKMLKEGNLTGTILYIICSVAVCILFVWMGAWSTEKFVK